MALLARMEVVLLCWKVMTMSMVLVDSKYYCSL